MTDAVEQPGDDDRWTYEDADEDELPAGHHDQPPTDPPDLPDASRHPVFTGDEPAPDDDRFYEPER